jgi:hypothetical protein
MEEALTELEKYTYDTGAELVAWLRAEFDNLEYDNIRERLEKNEGQKKIPGAMADTRRGINHSKEKKQIP